MCFQSIELHVAPDGATSLGLYVAINILLLRSKEFSALSPLFGQSLIDVFRGKLKNVVPEVGLEPT